MIDKAEIEEKSKEFEIHPSNVERDYVFGWLLFGIFTESDMKDSIFLKGGNALRKGYFSNTRFSTDLDFGIPGDIDQANLLNQIKKVCEFIQDKAGVVFRNDDTKVEEKFSATEAPVPGLRVYEVRVYFNDFYGNPDHIRIRISMDVTRFDRVILPIQKVKLIHPYSDADSVVCEISCMKLEEIIATKLKCLLQRQHAPDLFDYVYSIKQLGGTLDKQETIRVFIQKTIFGRNPYVLKTILLKTPFDFFREYWDKTLICAKQVIFGVEEAITFFIEQLESLFEMYPDNGYAQFQYFEPDLRIPIMEAGRTQTLLRIRYKGSDRIVEPYSLKFLQRRDGSEREYFYVFNRSGGENESGIRCFVADRVEAIDNTEERFEPRYPIELSKAGERPENPYLFDPYKPLRAPTRTALGMRRGRTKSTSYGPRYVFKCSYCGKQFTKRTNNGTLNPHKSKNGYPCGGRFGYYITTRYQ
jgi:predicted nucleotidyltransferase component of viral defense system